MATGTLVARMKVGGTQVDHASESFLTDDRYGERTLGVVCVKLLNAGDVISADTIIDGTGTWTGNVTLAQLTVIKSADL